MNGNDYELGSGFVVMILNNPARNTRVSTLIEIDRDIRGGDALLRSGPPITLTPFEQEAFNDQRWTLAVVAVDLASQQYVGYMSAHCMVTRCRGTKFEIEEVVTHPEFKGRGVGKAIMAVALKECRGRWSAKKAALTSRAGRTEARGLYFAFGFEEKGEGPFSLEFGDGEWNPPEAARPRFWCGVHPEDGGSVWHMGNEFRKAVLQICTGTLEPMAPWHVGEPIGVYKYKDAP